MTMGLQAISRGPLLDARPEVNFRSLLIRKSHLRSDSLIPLVLCTRDDGGE